MLTLSGGSIPLDIEGTYFRNGHAKFEVGKVDKVMHPFDADGMISAVTIKDGQGIHSLTHALTHSLTYSRIRYPALFRNRFVLTKGFKKERKARRILYRGAFGTGKAGTSSTLTLTHARTHSLTHSFVHSSTRRNVEQYV